MKSLALLCLFLLLAVPAYPQEWFVATDGNDTTGIGLTYDSAYFTISKAVDTVNALNLKYQIVWVAPGTYPELVDNFESSTTIIGDSNGIKWAGRTGDSIITGENSRTMAVNWSVATVSIVSFVCQSATSDILRGADPCYASLLSDLKVSGAGVDCIEMTRGQLSTITGCRVTDAGSGYGIKIFSTASAKQAVTISWTDVSCATSAALYWAGYASGEPLTITDSSFYSGDDVCISQAGGSPSILAYRSRFYGSGSGVFYVQPASVSASIIESCYLKSSGSATAGAQLQTTYGDSIVFKNCFFDTNRGFNYYNSTSVASPEFYNSIWAGQTFTNADPTQGATVKVANSVLWFTGTDGLYTAGDSVILPPTNPNFCTDGIHLRSNSSTWGAGTETGGATLDIDGLAFADYFRFPGMGVYAEAGCWTPTPTRTPSSANTATPTPTPSPSPTPSRTPTPSQTPTPSPTPTAVNSPSPSVTPTPSPRNTPDVLLYYGFDDFDTGTRRAGWEFGGCNLNADCYLEHYYYGILPPGLRMNESTAGVYFTSETLVGSSRTLGWWSRGSGVGGSTVAGTLEVQGLIDEDFYWTTLNYSSVTTMAAETSGVFVDDDVVRLRFRYTKLAGDLAVDDFTYDAVTPSRTPTPGESRTPTPTPTPTPAGYKTPTPTPTPLPQQMSWSLLPFSAGGKMLEYEFEAELARWGFKAALVEQTGL